MKKMQSITNIGLAIISISALSVAIYAATKTDLTPEQEEKLNQITSIVNIEGNQLQVPSIQTDQLVLTSSSNNTTTITHLMSDLQDNNINNQTIYTIDNNGNATIQVNNGKLIHVLSPFTFNSMTSTERENLNSVQQGTFVYDTTAERMFIYQRSQWSPLILSDDPISIITGTSGQITITNPNANTTNIALTETGVTSGNYSFPGLITVNDTGQITDIDDTIPLPLLGTPNQINVSTSTNPVISLVNTSVVPNDYTWLNASIDAQGRITTASSNPVPILAIQGTTNEINVSSGTSPTISLVDTTVVPGIYTYPSSITVNSKGQLTDIVSGSGSAIETITGTSGQIDVTSGSNPVISLDPTMFEAIEAWHDIRPSGTPSDLQLLQYELSNNRLNWKTIGSGIFPFARTIYVDKGGSDTIGTGSNIQPFLTPEKAIQTALPLTSTSSLTLIIINSGSYTINNSAGPITINVSGLSIIGQNARGTVLVPQDPTKDLFNVTGTSIIFSMSTIRLETNVNTSTAAAITTSGTLTIIIQLCSIRFFAIGLNLIGDGNRLTTALIDENIFSQNKIPIYCNGINGLINDNQIVGTGTLNPLTTYNGILIEDSTTIVYVTACVFQKCGYGIKTQNACISYVSTNNFINTINSVIIESQSQCTLTACIFTKFDTNYIGCQVKDTGSILTLTSCDFDGRNFNQDPTGTAIQITQGGIAKIKTSTIVHFNIGIDLGLITDTNTTKCIMNGTSLTDNIISVQTKSTTTFIGALIIVDTLTNWSFEDTTNVKLSGANANTDPDNDGFLCVGPLTNTHFPFLQLETRETNKPTLHYHNDLEGSVEAITFENLDTDINISGTATISNQDCISYIMSKTLGSNTSLALLSDTSSLLDGSSIKSWNINHDSTTGNLSYSYTNTADNTKPIITDKSILEIDPVNDIIELYDNTLEWQSDTNLYRDSANILKTDGNFIINGLSSGNRALYVDANKQLTSSTVTNTELDYLSGTTSNIQDQLDDKVDISGSTMTGTLTVIAGTVNNPGIAINGTGIYSNGLNHFCIANNSIQTFHIDSVGTLQLPTYTTQGILHNNSSGILSSSLIVNNDITNATITNTKLATVSSTSNPNYIMSRDGSSNCELNMLTLFGTPTNDTDATTKQYVDTLFATGFTVHDPVVAVSVTNITTLSGLLIIDNYQTVDNDRVLLIAQAFPNTPDNNGPWVVQTGSWLRPTDFQDTELAGNSFFLVTNGDDYKGTSWVCNTPTATIGTDPLTFAQFSLPTDVSGQNVGTGTGEVFQMASGNTLYFRRLSQNNGIILTNNTNDIEISTNGTSNATSDTLMLRDNNGDVSVNTLNGNVNGTANGNVANTGGIMTGNLELPAGTNIQPSLNFTNSVTTGLGAPNVNTLSLYTNGSIRQSISSTGVITFNNYNSTGVLHTNGSGTLSTSLIVNADISDSANIANNKLAPIDTPGMVTNQSTSATALNTNNTIMLRDSLGNTALNVLTANTVNAIVNGTANGNVAKTGDNMSGPLILPLGSSSVPSLSFNGSTTTGLHSSSSGLSISTNASERLNINSSGEISINTFTVPGIVHNSLSGLLTSSLIVNADISPSATIGNNKLAPLSAPDLVLNSATSAVPTNTANAIVSRDSNGDCAVNTMTANSFVGTLTGSASLNVLKSGDSMTNPLLQIVGSAANPSFGFTTQSGTGMYSNVSGSLNFATNATNRLSISNTGTITISGLNSTGIVHNNSSGDLSTSLIVNADISVSAAIGNDKLATLVTPGLVQDSATSATPANTPSTIMSRDSSGNTALNVITANSFIGNLTGSASLNVLKSGDNMTGVLGQILGTSSSPSYGFTTQPGVGMHANSSGSLHLSTNSVDRLSISNTGTVTISNLNSTGIVHNNSSGLLTTSLIVDADITNATISNGKLATASATNTTSSVMLRDGSGNTNVNSIGIESGSFTMGTTNITTITRETPTTTTSYQLPAIAAANAKLAIVSNVTSSYIPMSNETVTVSTVSALTTAALAGGIITHNQATATFPTGAAIKADVQLLPFNNTGKVFKVLFSNNRNGACTLSGNTGTTILAQNAEVPARTSRLLYFVNTGDATWSIY